MPDFERITDSLFLHLSDDKSYAQGYIDGKSAARWGIVKTVSFLAMLISVCLVGIHW
jgi:hypothetical protein